MKPLIIAVALLLAMPASALTIDADTFAFQQFGPYSAGEAPMFTLLSRKPCGAKGGAGWRRAQLIVAYGYGQTSKDPFCWKEDAEYYEAVMLCPVNQKGVLNTQGYLACMRHLKENYIDTSTLPSEARF